MKFRTHLRLRDNDPGNDTGGGGSPPPPPALTRPDGLADDFWDAEKGVKYDAVLPILSAHAERSKITPAKPEDIDWTLPGDLDPDNKDAVYEVDKDDPLLGEVSKLAVEHGATQPFLSALGAAYAKFQIGQAKQAREALVAEEKKLGDKVMERIAGAQAFVESVVGKEKAQRFRNTWVTAEQVEIIEALAKRAAGPAPATGDPAEPPSESKGRTFYSGMATSEKK